MVFYPTLNQLHGLGQDTNQFSRGIEPLLLLKPRNLSHESIDQFHHFTHGAHQTNGIFSYFSFELRALYHNNIVERPRGLRMRRVFSWH